MSYIKISQLPLAPTVTNDDYLVIVDNPNTSGVTRKITFSSVSGVIADIVSDTFIAGSGIVFTQTGGNVIISADIDGGNI